MWCHLHSCMQYAVNSTNKFLHYWKIRYVFHFPTDQWQIISKHFLISWFFRMLGNCVSCWKMLNCNPNQRVNSYWFLQKFSYFVTQLCYANMIISDINTNKNFQLWREQVTHITKNNDKDVSDIASNKDVQPHKKNYTNNFCISSPSS